MKNVDVRLLPLSSRRSSRLLLSCVVALSALAGCGGSVAPIDVMAGCPEMPLRGPEEFAAVPPERVIDDFEDGDLMLNRAAGLTGSWIGSAAVAGGVMFGASSNRCVARGTHSGHLSGLGPQNYPVTFNGGLGSVVAPFDASTYSGISFWIALGDTAVPPFKTPIGVSTTDTALGGACMTCGDYYAIRERIPLTRTWTRWFVPFSDLAQYGFGVPQVPLNRSRLVNLIIWPEPQQFDIWIDDVRFEL